MIVWFGIVVCLSQSALFSGMNIALFSVSRMRLEVAAADGQADALQVLELRKQSNLTLTTILWGNVAINVLLALLAESVMSGVIAFCFSTIVITFLGEILPQAWFSRHAVKMAARMSPLLRFYMLLLYPVAKPSSVILDAWIGPEGVQYYRERDFRGLIRRHIDAGSVDISHIEGIGALNFLAIDDRPVKDVGNEVAPASIVKLAFTGDKPNIPGDDHGPDAEFLAALRRNEEAWTILTDAGDEPRLALDTDQYLRRLAFDERDIDITGFLYQPTILRNDNTTVGEALPCLVARPVENHTHHGTRRLLLVWSSAPRIITSDDLLDELLHGVIPAGPNAGSAEARADRG